MHFFQQFHQITKFVEDCDRKVAANKKRLEETQDQESLAPEAVIVHELNEKIGKKLSEAEELGKKLIFKFQFVYSQKPTSLYSDFKN